EQAVERDAVDVAVEGLAVGVRELRALGDDVHALGRRQRGEIEAMEQRELLEEDRPLAPGAGLAHGPAAVLVPHRRLERGAPAREVVSGEEPAAGCAEAVDRLRDEAAVEDVARALDLRLARAI